MIRFVVALQAEARPLLDQYRMELAGEGPFQAFRGRVPDAGEAWLIVSGHGKAAAAAATAYLHLLSGGHPDRVWLNVGIGGHCQRPVGEAHIAHKIQDAASGAAWYPQIVVDTPRTTAPLLTIEKVEEEYAPPWIYETEASGFFPTACRFSTVELVHCFKVISDNPETTLTRRTSAHVQGLIKEHLEGITEFAVALAGLAREVEALAADPPGYREALERWRFPATQQHRLRRLLRRLAILAPGELYGGVHLGELTDARAVLRALEAGLAGIPIHLPEPMEVLAS